MNAQPEPTDRAEVAKLAAAVEEALAGVVPASYRNEDPDVPSYEDGARTGDAPPVPQPGRAAMSSGAVDYCARVLSTGVATALFSGSIALVMLASRWADPVVCGIVFCAPIGLAVPIAALSSLAGRAKEVVQAAPPTINQHYSGTVHQTQHNTTINTDTRGFIAINRNEFPTTN